MSDQDWVSWAKERDVLDARHADKVEESPDGGYLLPTEWAVAMGADFAPDPRKPWQRALCRLTGGRLFPAPLRYFPPLDGLFVPGIPKLQDLVHLEDE